ncbi:hypothetical protein VNI00_013570 [Paramarasmius palmivorus]|uniref:Uncharacterized protein n=1 Tax=Paramarasmius palmivorus TaxID=297713 RepID=A0AAW0BWP6_9AGAR
MNQSYTQQAPLGKSNTPNVPSNNQRSNNKGPASSNSRNANTIDPMQIAKLVVQQIPQLQAFLPPQLVQPLMQQQPVYAQPAPQAAPAPVPVASAQTRSVPVNNPFSGSPQPAPAADPFSAAFTSSNPTTFTVQQSSAPVRVDCRIPDCGKPVHVDSQGFSSEYCSMKHREEAVSSGLVSPCIMCLELPQSEADYFCGRACREEALDKQLIRPQED